LDKEEKKRKIWGYYWWVWLTVKRKHSINRDHGDVRLHKNGGVKHDDERVGWLLHVCMDGRGKEGNKGRRRYRLEFGGGIPGKIETHNSKQAKQTKKSSKRKK